LKALLLILCITSSVAIKTPEEPDYRRVFGNDYSWAVRWLNQHNKLIERYALQMNIPPKEIKAIVFPELIRYNSLRNALEVETLKYLYVREGTPYADFSVGFFQMKPSFAEMVEADGLRFLPASIISESGWTQYSSGEENSRKERLKRLSDIEQQLIYLCAFYKICEKRFDRSFNNTSAKVKFFATCYNAGYRRSYKDLETFQQRTDFYNYNYSSVSQFYLLNE
jgi:hypothetical protein